MKKTGILGGAALAAIAWTVPAAAQERADGTCYVSGDEGESLLCYDGDAILVPGSRARDLTLEDYTGSATILDAETLRRRQVRDVSDVLRDVAGVAVSAVAGQTQLRLRGSEANHVLVLVDGIEVSDPFGGEFDIGTLQAEIGARVEVLRGPQSALYGSDAIGGVIAYESGHIDGLSAMIEAGSDNTLNGAARGGFNSGGLTASLSAVAVTTDGQPNARSGVRNIGRDSYTVAGKAEAEASSALTFRAAARFIRTTGDFNDPDFDTSSPTFGFIVDSPDTRFANEAVYALVGARLETMGDAWTHDLSAQVADISRDTFGPFGRTFGSEGDRLKASYVSALRFDEHSFTVAADWEREGFRNTDPFGFAFTGRRETENVGLVGEYRLAADRFDVSAALRHDFNTRFADATTFRVGAGFDVTDTTRLRASAGSGVKNPGFYELFGYVDGRFIGNENLRPEKSTGWEVGIDQTLLGEKLRLSATYFHSELEAEIFTTFPAPDFIATPANRDTESRQRGLELSARARLGGGVWFDAAYTYLDAEENGVAEVRRPQDIASVALGWAAPDDAASASLVVRHNGAALDDAFIDPSYVPVRVTLDDYTLVNAYGELRLAHGVRLFARAENLLDQRYEQVFSFVSPGRTATVGIRADF